MRSDDQEGQDGRRLAGAAAPRALDTAPGAETEAEVAPIEEPRFLFFRCAGADCAVPLAALREVLPQCPAALPLPHSPEWLLGVFALRAELVGLADPAPLLFGAAADRVPVKHEAALLAGVGARVLAWAVESIGATTPFAPREAADAAGTVAAGALPAGGAADDSRELEPTVAARYTAGVIALAAGRRFTVIHAETLLADMLGALEERPAIA